MTLSGFFVLKSFSQPRGTEKKKRALVEREFPTSDES